MKMPLGIPSPDSPVHSVAMDRWRLIHSYLMTESITKHHLDSFNHLLDVTIPAIIKENPLLVVAKHPHFYLRIEKVDVKQVSHGSSKSPGSSTGSNVGLTPHECRQRNMTYAAPITIDVRCRASNKSSVQYYKDICIGHIPIMLRSNRCILASKSRKQQAFLQECPDDPGGYFIVRGAEKSILLAEQITMNRIVLGRNTDGNIEVTVASNTTERKSRCAVLYKNKKFYLIHNKFNKKPIPIVTIFKAMGFVNDVTVLSLIGTDQLFLDYMSLSVQECSNDKIYTQEQALKYLADRIVVRTYANTNVNFPTSPVAMTAKASIESARDCLAHFVLSHIPVVERLNLQQVAQHIQPQTSASTASNTSVGTHTGTTATSVGGKSGSTSATTKPAIGSGASAVASNTGSTAPPVNMARFNWLPKAVYLATMIRRAILFDFGVIKGDSKDFVGNKKIETAGDLLELIFDDAFKTLLAHMARKVDAILRPDKNRGADLTNYDVVSLVDPSIITRAFNSAISTGNWKIERIGVDRVGVSQVLSRLSYISTLGQVTRLSSTFDKAMKSSGPRMLNFSQMGIFCPSDTPEGESVGIVKNLSIMARISKDENADSISKLLMSIGVEDLASCWSGDTFSLGYGYMVFLNGTIKGVIAKDMLKGFIITLRTFRRKGYISYLTSFHFNDEHQAVYINCDSGRACRPLLIVENGKLKLTLNDIELLVNNQKCFVDFIYEGKVEYLDVNEAKNAYIAMDTKDLTPQHTHCEIESYTLLGYVVGLIPYPHHNQSPRNCYQCSMGKQASGAIAFNQFERFETAMFLLDYPQRPLTSTKILKLTGYERLPAGQNATVCVMSYSSFDIEDALILNRSAIDRGFGRCSIYRSVSAELNSTGSKSVDGTKDVLLGPPKDHLKQYESYHAVEDDGLCAVGAHLKTGDIVINKGRHVTNIPGLSDGPEAAETLIKSPESLKSPLETITYIDKVLVTTNNDGNLLIKVLTREPRRPEVGDKFSSRHGQKGVCGLIVSQSDLPFTSQGIVPDLIMNPHGYPSRMTVAKLLELLSNKSSCFRGEQTDGTCFRTKTDEEFIAELYDSLRAAGFSYSGKDVLYSGLTGDVIPVYIFNGPIYYQKLKHMVKDKIHSRGTGPITMLTRQPTEGRRVHGGLRMGEMERDCAISYGASALLLERFMLSSDEFLAYVCEACGLFSYERNGALWCPTCQSGKDVVKIRIPYAAKLMIQELISMGVLVRMQLEDSV